jgi:hypothetical protein
MQQVAANLRRQGATSTEVIRKLEQSGQVISRVWLHHRIQVLAMTLMHKQASSEVPMLRHEAVHDFLDYRRRRSKH